MNKFHYRAGAGFLTLLACALYLPFLGNPWVFDDWTLFGGSDFAYFATHPFDFFRVRNIPYFSLAFTYTQGMGMPVQRAISLALHLACSITIFRLIYDLLRLVAPANPAGLVTEAERSATIWALSGAAVFAIHPVAVYGAGYLIQRSIVLATLFSLLSILMFLRGLRRGAHSDAVSAALLYCVAVYSKEHSLLLPAIAAMTVVLAATDRRFALRHCAIYLALCAPAAIQLALVSKGVIGLAYEPDSAAVADQIDTDLVHGAATSWSLSAATQAGLFFKYVFLWIWPDVRSMSVDLRVAFADIESTGLGVLKGCAFVLYGALGCALLLRRGRLGLIGFGLLYSWILFLIEFGTVRFQEPFVLYRSYLWAPGIILILVSLLSFFPRRAGWLIMFVTCPILFYQAHDRLTTFSHSFLLWQDAVAKLPEKPVPWGSRTLHNLAREYVFAGKPEKAAAIVERCMSEYRDAYHCHFAKGALLSGLGNYAAALPYLTRAIALKPDSVVAHLRLASTLEQLGRGEEAIEILRQASKRGLSGVDMDLRRMESAKIKSSFPIHGRP